MIDKETLVRLYIEENRTMGEIGAMFGKSDGTIAKCLKTHDIPARSGRDAQRAINPPRHELVSLYLEKQMSIDAIAKHLGSSEFSIQMLLNEYQIPIRDKSAHLGGWNKGQQMSENQKAILSEYARQRTGKKSPRYGAKLNEATRQKIANSLKGRFRKHLNPNWKNGGIKQYRIIVGGRHEYADWRKAVFMRDGYTCRDCGKPSNGDIQGHHIVPVNVDPSQILNIENGITLCEKCHGAIKGKERQNESRYKAILHLPTP